MKKALLIVLQHVLSALFPGLGHFPLRRPFRAAFFATVFFCCVEGIIFTIFFFEGRFFEEALIQSAAAVGIFVWLSAHMDIIRIRHLLKFATDEIFVEGVRTYLKNELDESEKIMKRLLLADPYNVEARMYLSLIYAEKGWTRAARRQLRKCRELDTKGVLEWETRTELERLKTARNKAA